MMFAYKTDKDMFAYQQELGYGPHFNVCPVSHLASSLFIQQAMAKFKAPAATAATWLGSSYLASPIWVMLTQTLQ